MNPVPLYLAESVLFLADPILLWPKLTVWVGLGAILFFLSMFIVYLTTRRHVEKQSKEDTQWYVILNYLNKHQLVTREIGSVRRFYDSLNPKLKEDIISSKRKFHALYNDFLVSEGHLKMEDRVNLIQKLFPHSENNVEVKTLADLFEGELCALELDGLNLLVHIVTIDPEDLLLSAYSTVESTGGENFLRPIEKNESAALYVYRPHIGGFLVYGFIKMVERDSISFRFNGTVEHKGQQHMMAGIMSPFTLQPWPSPEAGSKAEGHIITGTTIQISDRAMLIEAKNREDVPYYLNRHEIWVIMVTLPSGYIFKCRGLVKASREGAGEYIFKFLDAPEIARQVLYREIQSHDPEKENLS